MSAVYLCDGCGKQVDAPEKVGRVIQREYCPECAGIANQFLDAEKKLIASLHQRLVSERELLMAKFSVNGFKLPDCP